jgi:hypothetical protein
MLTTAGFAIVGCLLMAATALAQELQQGLVCQEVIGPDSGHYCGATPTRAKYSFTNTGIHDLGLAPSSGCWGSDSIWTKNVELLQVIDSKTVF